MILKLACVHIFEDAYWIISQQNSSFYWNEGKARLMSYIALCWLSNALKLQTQPKHGCVSVWTEKQASACCSPEPSYMLSFRWEFAREWTFSNEPHSLMLPIPHHKDLPHVLKFSTEISLFLPSAVSNPFVLWISIWFAHYKIVMQQLGTFPAR